MRAILFSLATMVAVVSCTIPTGLENIYKKMCAGKKYTDPVTGITSTNYQPWEFIKGYQLGTQITSTDTDSTCYGETKQTFDFIDSMVSGSYSWMTEIFQGKFDTVGQNTQTTFQNLNSLVIQLSDQQIAC